MPMEPKSSLGRIKPLPTSQNSLPHTPVDRDKE
jgi:hypothetical protein